MDHVDVEMSAPGSVQAFEALYDRYAPAVARFAWSVAPTSEAAKDLLQETFLTAWAKRRSIRLVDGSPLPWLLTTCRNHARNHARRERKWRELVELRDESTAAGDSDSGAEEDLRWALEAVANLPTGERQATELVVVAGLSYRQAAKAMGVSEAAVGKRVSRARARLREGLGE